MENKRYDYTIKKWCMILIIESMTSGITVPILFYSNLPNAVSLMIESSDMNTFCDYHAVLCYTF